MNKGEFIKSVADKAGLTQKEANAAYDAMFSTVVEALKANDKVALVGFGTFELKSKPARTGINPQTKQPYKKCCKNLQHFYIKLITIATNESRSSGVKATFLLFNRISTNAATLQATAPAKKIECSTISAM